MQRNLTRTHQKNQHVKGTFSTYKGLRCWHRLPTDAVHAPSRGVFQFSLGGTLGNLT